MKRTLLGLYLAAAATLAIAGSAPAADSQIFLSWRAPYGEPRATSVLETSCDDTTRVDTLYLSFQIDKRRPVVRRLEGVLTFTPQDGDTLQPFWFFQTGGPNGGNMVVDFCPFVENPCRSVWGFVGDGEVRYGQLSGRTRLGIHYDVPEVEAQAMVPNTRYCFARIRVRHRRPDLRGCTQPVCVEWSTARLTFGTDTDMDLTGGSERFATWNLPPGRSCGSGQWNTLAKPWRPKPRTTGSKGN